MSNFPPLPPPYTPPFEGGPDWNIGYVPPDALRPARRAATLMLILGALALLVGLMFFAVSAVPIQQFPPETRQQLEQLVAQSGWSVKASLVASGIMMSIPGILLGIMALLVRGGRFGAIITAMVLDGLLILMAAIAILSALLTSGGNPLSCAPFVIAEAVMIAMMSYLRSAAKAANAARKAALQYQWQYWQYHQMGEQSGYGYGQQQPPPGGKL
jgi:hypothetical protein